jgi:uncharacterized protein YbaR (Trm112 family)
MPSPSNDPHFVPLPVDDALLAVVRCPVTGERLVRDGNTLRTPSGRAYRIVDGLPVLVPRAGDQPAETGSAGMS